MRKIFLVGMTQNRIGDFREIVQYSDKYFDGLIFVDHFSTDGTYELLEKHKKDGKIIRRPYYKQHSHSQNEILFCRHANNGDWMLLNDSSERVLPKWLFSMREDIDQYEASGIQGVCFSGRIYLWQYFDCQEFVGSPHWGINGIRGKVVTFGEENKGQYVLNKRNENKVEHYAMHPIFYWFCHNPSNEALAMYGKYGQDVVNKHELIRQRFRLYCENNLKLSLDNLDGLINYMKKIESGEVIPDSFFIGTVENEFRLSELFQLKVLGFDFMTKMHPRYKWSFKNHLTYGDGWYDKSYEGTILKYDKGIFE